MKVSELEKLFSDTRNQTASIVECVREEEMLMQPHPWVSPIKWHLGHTTWFFEQMILKEIDKDYQLDPEYCFAFNSYYDSFGKRVARDNRASLVKPSLEDVMNYRHKTDRKILDSLKAGVSDKVMTLCELGVHHEKQHQELIFQDFKSIRSKQSKPEAVKNPLGLNFQSFENPGHFDLKEGLYSIGKKAGGEGAFAYDNEQPQHKVYLYPSKISNQLVTNKEYLEFMEAGGYDNFAFWLSDGWQWVDKQELKAPLYWRKSENTWQEFCLWKGWHSLDFDRPVSHVNYYEAYAYSKWKKARLPLEAELEIRQGDTNQQESLWQWTTSDYNGYPGYKPANDATMEYNSKFMCSQKVLRGGSSVTPKNHYRSSYRNFYYPQERWMYSGIRLAYDK